MTDIGPLPPHDIEAEEAVIAAMLVPDGWPSIPDLASRLSANDFFREKHGWLFDAAMERWRSGEEPNQITVAATLAARGQLEPAGGQSWIADVIRRLPTAVESATLWYADIVHKAARQRSQISLLHRLTNAAYSADADPDELLSSAIEQLLRLSEGRHKVLTRSVGEVLRGDGQPRGVGVAERIEAFIQDPTSVQGIPCGWEELDTMLRGFQDGRVYTLTGDTSVGKSFMVLYLAWQMARSGHPVLIVSTEMQQWEITERLVFMEAGLDRKYLERSPVLPYQADAIRAATDRLADLPLYITDVGRIPLPTLVAESRRMVATHGVRGVFIDHIQHINVPGSTGVQAIESITSSTKALAMNSDVFVFQVTHPSREGVKFGLNLHSGKGGASIEQDSDVFLILEPVQWDADHWRVLEEREASAFQSRNGFQPVRLTVAKGRSGGKGWALRSLDWNTGGRFQPLDLE